MRINIIVISLIAVFFFAGNALAGNITIFDGMGTYGEKEDGTVEPNCVNNQSWDLEAFLFDGKNLSIVGGYDFVDGEYGSGNIFIDTDGEFYGADHIYDEVKYPVAYKKSIVESNFGYEYAIKLGFGDNGNGRSYTVYDISDDTAKNSAVYTKSVKYYQNRHSNAWQYASGGTELKNAGGTFSYRTGLSNSDTGFVGGSHKMVSEIDLSFIGGMQDFTAHFTMGCGNDNLMGSSTTAPVPEPSSLILFGVGLGFIGLRRKFIK